jgi:septal ring factor EnvC (AmiA/AmiB activator)
MEGIQGNNNSSHLNVPAKDCIVAQPLLGNGNEDSDHTDDNSEDVPMDLESTSSEAVSPSTSRPHITLARLQYSNPPLQATPLTAPECQRCKDLESQLANKDGMIKAAVEQVNALRAQLADQRDTARAEEEELRTAVASLKEEQLRLIAHLAEQTRWISELQTERDEARKKAEDLEKTLFVFKEEISYVADKVKDAVNRL